MFLRTIRLAGRRLIRWLITSTDDPPGWRCQGENVLHPVILTRVDSIASDFNESDQTVWAFVDCCHCWWRPSQWFGSNICNYVKWENKSRKPNLPLYNTRYIIFVKLKPGVHFESVEHNASNPFPTSLMQSFLFSFFFFCIASQLTPRLLLSLVSYQHSQTY